MSNLPKPFPKANMPDYTREQLYELLGENSKKGLVIVLSYLKGHGVDVSDIEDDIVTLAKMDDEREYRRPNTLFTDIERRQEEVVYGDFRTPSRGTPLSILIERALTFHRNKSKGHKS